MPEVDLPASLARRVRAAPARAGGCRIFAVDGFSGVGKSTLASAVAAELGVLISGGSDDHGKRTADGRMRLGSQPVPVEVLETSAGAVLEMAG